MMRIFFVHSLIQWLPALPSLFLFVFFFLFFRRAKSSVIPVNWPVVGMLPGIISHFHNLHDYVVGMLQDAPRQSLVVRGPWFLGMNFLLTCDPATINHIFNTRFRSYGKGDEFKEIFELLGDGILGAEFDSWKAQRKMAHAAFADRDFRSFAADTAISIIRDGLLPLLRHMAERGAAVDLQDVCLRFAFATNYKIVTGADHSDCLSTSLPAVDFLVGIRCVQEGYIFRQAVPPYFWKLLRWLNVGPERKLAVASQTVDRLVAEEISKRQGTAQDTTPPPPPPPRICSVFT